MESVEHDLVMLDGETGLPVFNPVARTIQEFRDLIASCRKETGTHIGGNRKAVAKMAGVFFVSSYKSPYYRLEDRDRRVKQVVEQVSNLEEKDIDARFIAACKRFEQLEYVPEIESLEELVSGLRLGLVYVRSLRQTLESVLRDDVQIMDIGTMDLVQTSLDKMITMADKIPDTVEKVERALTRVRKQTETRKHRRGKKTTFLRED